MGLVEEIAKAFGAFKAALDIMKAAKDLMPAGKQKEQIEQKLHEAEEASKLVRVQSASALGHVSFMQTSFPSWNYGESGRTSGE